MVKITPLNPVTRVVYQGRSKGSTGSAIDIKLYQKSSPKGKLLLFSKSNCYLSIIASFISIIFAIYFAFKEGETSSEISLSSDLSSSLEEKSSSAPGLSSLKIDKLNGNIDSSISPTNNGM